MAIILIFKKIKQFQILPVGQMKSKLFQRPEDICRARQLLLRSILGYLANHLYSKVRRMINIKIT